LGRFRKEAPASDSGLPKSSSRYQFAPRRIPKPSHVRIHDVRRRPGAFSGLPRSGRAHVVFGYRTPAVTAGLGKGPLWPPPPLPVWF